ncbi:hypothetical protein SEA_CAMBIARE_64 [Mycobacterium phage Cambiare]|uniref:Uncharacterized protein n=1 Tax=Mycobacterium phage Cambiare TaxID=1647305 RepID=A0A0F6WE55_9CAUD|nr:hypothetical protein AVT48_gp64 [Mycobacterium phage Cambiare]AKF14566.1 hypothetical protein SEA_CAMBIARE_64 [Mycobacterium phage Cambiare]
MVSSSHARNGRGHSIADGRGAYLEGVPDVATLPAGQMPGTAANFPATADE